MYKKHTILPLIILVVTLGLVGCDDGGSPQEVPTIIPVNGNVGTNNDDPTPTPETLGINAQDVETTVPPEPTERPFRPTLPPTWTPTDEAEAATPTLEPTQDEAAVIQPQAGGGVRPECDGFGPNAAVSDEEFPLGESAIIAWSQVENADLYWILITDISGNLAHQRYVEETNYTIPADVFLGPVRYGWEVRPLDSFGIQMCAGRGSTLLPIRE